jgi:hypothetical protein
MQDEYRTVARAGVHETEVNRSRFLCALAPAATEQQAQDFIAAVRTEHADATHNCWAFVVGPPGSTGRVGMSDAGEPHGTAGRPMLNVLLHAGVGDVAAVVGRVVGDRCRRTEAGRRHLVVGQRGRSVLRVAHRDSLWWWGVARRRAGPW